jgi:sugar phosphate isomerase/epimerase
VPRTRSFGISTILCHGQRLTREHVREMGAAGFDAVELMATRTHVDYHSDAAIADLQGWLADARLALASVHAPVAERFTGGRYGGLLNLASSDATEREHALAEAVQALHVARRLPFGVLVVHIGVPKGHQPTAPGENSRDGARRSIEALAAAARPLGVIVAVELIPNELSRAGPLVHFVEDVVDAGAASICLDLGHARLEGDVVDVVETVSEHIALVHAHDNRGRADDHLVPFEGAIDWPGAMTAIQKVGYEGPVIIEIDARGAVRDTLARARAARTRLDRLLAHW